VSWHKAAARKPANFGKKRIVGFFLPVRGVVCLSEKRWKNSGYKGFCPRHKSFCEKFFWISRLVLAESKPWILWGRMYRTLKNSKKETRLCWFFL
jgi:hypothetical protein